jgi:hypothetical protein
MAPCTIGFQPGVGRSLALPNGFRPHIAKTMYVGFLSLLPDAADTVAFLLCCTPDAVCFDGTTQLAGDV